jgi:hypothetical protein
VIKYEAFFENHMLAQVDEELLACFYIVYGLQLSSLDSPVAS